MSVSLSGAQHEGVRLRGTRYATIDPDVRAELESLEVIPGEPYIGQWPHAYRVVITREELEVLRAARAHKAARGRLPSLAAAILWESASCEEDGSK